MSEVLGTWIDGIAATQVPADDRGLQYGDGVFETILVRNGRARFLDAHVARMREGLGRLAIEFSAEAALRAEIAHAVARAPELAVLKIVVTRGSARRRGYAPSRDERARRIVSLWPAKPLERPEQGVCLRVAGLRVAGQPALAGIKHLNRLESVLASAEAPDDASFDSVLLDIEGNIVSGTMCNLFVVKSGELVTPPVERAGVAGIVRGIVLREGPRLGIAARERTLTLDDLAHADEVLVTNARIGVVPVRRVGEHAFSMFALALKLRGHVEALDA